MAVSCSAGKAWDEDEGTERHKLLNTHPLERTKVHAVFRHKTHLIVFK